MLEVDGGDVWPGQGVKWKGIGILKSPNDLFRQAQIIWETKPDIIVETGTWMGGSAYWYAELRAQVHSVDVSERLGRRVDARNVYYTGDSLDPDIVSSIRQACEGKKVMVVLDSEHTKKRILGELDAYADLVSPGCYLIVEDLVLYPEVGEGLREWLPDHPEFTIDEDIMVNTDHPGGYLIRT